MADDICGFELLLLLFYFALFCRISISCGLSRESIRKAKKTDREQSEEVGHIIEWSHYYLTHIPDDFSMCSFAHTCTYVNSTDHSLSAVYIIMGSR